MGSKTSKPPPPAYTLTPTSIPISLLSFQNVYNELRYNNVDMDQLESVLGKIYPKVNTRREKIKNVTFNYFPTKIYKISNFTLLEHIKMKDVTKFCGFMLSISSFCQVREAIMAMNIILNKEKILLKLFGKMEEDERERLKKMELETIKRLKEKEDDLIEKNKVG